VTRFPYVSFNCQVPSASLNKCWTSTWKWPSLPVLLIPCDSRTNGTTVFGREGVGALFVSQCIVQISDWKCNCIPDNSVRTVIDLRDGRQGFDSQQEQESFSHLHRIHTGSGADPTHNPMGTWVQRPKREGNHSPPPIAEVKNTWSYTSTPSYVFMAWCLSTGYVFVAWYLVKHRYNFTLQT